ncbi:PAS domain-containing sensor histidine kinase [Halobaculum lipolyticum]|uniref:histidine kinase n=1 Tax=Halobaculum lipolyticum TaxID=3032001 RepID=A0ABD5WEY0_9EURY|nr:PAS domain-containing sensor histidine kinase [Halobaculum sp. DT31]
MATPDPMGLLLDRAQDKIVLLDGSGICTHANAAVGRLLGFEPAEYVGTCPFDYVHPDDVDEVRRLFEAATTAEGHTEATVEYRHRTADGGWVWLESRLSSVPDSALGGYVISSRDITDRVDAEQERRQTSVHLREIAGATGDVLWLFSGDWSELLFVNPAYEQLYGRPVEELEGDPRSFLEAVHPDDVPAVEAAMDRLSAGTSVDLEYRVVSDRADDRWVWVQGEPIVRDGEVTRIAGFTKDVSDRHRRTRQLYVMDNLLRHNLRNDLNVILGTAEEIEAAVPAAAEGTALIQRTGEDLLRTANKEREVIDLIADDCECRAIDLGAVVADAVETVRRHRPDAAIDVTTPEGVVVDGLPELRQAVVELLENAIRHCDADTPRVAVRLRRDGATAAVTVEDEAPPIPAMDAAVLTGDHEMDDIYHSSGLGLWLVYWCVALSNGRVAVDSGPDRGNRVTVSIPLSTE